MENRRKYYNNFVIDKLTNSITNTISGDNLPTEVSLLSKTDVKTLNKKNGWLFDWRKELLMADREVYKLTIIHNPQIIQRVVSLTVKTDHVFLHLIENAPFNRNKEKLYEGVAGNLVAFVCRLSFQRGSDGFIAFHAKTNLINHYIKTLQASHFGNNLMVIDTNAARVLVDKYFKS